MSCISVDYACWEEAYLFSHKNVDHTRAMRWEQSRSVRFLILGVKIWKYLYGSQGWPLVVVAYSCREKMFSLKKNISKIHLFSHFNSITTCSWSSFVNLLLCSTGGDGILSDCVSFPIFLSCCFACPYFLELNNDFHFPISKLLFLAATAATAATTISNTSSHS